MIWGGGMMDNRKQWEKIARVPAQSASAVNQVAEKIREDVFQLPDGTLLGSEDELISRYNVSRPTLRQAAGLIIQEQLLVARRGVGGGFFVRRPDADVVTHIVSQYLRSRNVGIKQLAGAVRPIRVEIARLAAISDDAETRARMAAFLEQEEPADQQLEFLSFLQRERAFNHLLGELSGSATLSLFLEILLDLSSMVHRESDMYRGYPERLTAYRRERLRLAQAVMEADDELAVLAARRCAKMSHQWLMNELIEVKKSARPRRKKK
jgi:DNA-binding FadR family transcriptional regulator